MEYELHITDRMNILQLLPKEGNFLTLKSIRVAKESLALSPDEIKEYEIKEDNGQITWNIEKAKKLAKIDIDDTIVSLIKKELRSLDDNNKIQERQFNIYKIFIGE